MLQQHQLFTHHHATKATIVVKLIKKTWAPMLIHCPQVKVDLKAQSWIIATYLIVESFIMSPPFL
jgi:hypothetical protein